MVDDSVSAWSTLQEIANAIRNADFAQAEEIGMRDANMIPLCISKSEVSIGDMLTEGAQASIREVMVSLGGQHAKMAMKKAIIREPMDLLRFRKEVYLLMILQHQYIVKIRAARMIPPLFFRDGPVLSQCWTCNTLWHVEAISLSNSSCWREDIPCFRFHSFKRHRTQGCQAGEHIGGK